MKVTNPLGSQYDALTLPEHTFTIQMETPQKLTNVGESHSGFFRKIP